MERFVSLYYPFSCAAQTNLSIDQNSVEAGLCNESIYGSEVKVCPGPEVANVLCDCNESALNS